MEKSGSEFSGKKIKNDAGVRIFKKLIELAMKYPETTPDKVTIISGTSENVEKLLSKSKMKLINIVRFKQPKTIGKLSKIANRPIESVSRDLRLLNSYGLIRFEKNGKEKCPKTDKEIIIIPLSH